MKKFTPISPDLLKKDEHYPFNIYKEIEEKIFVCILPKHTLLTDELFLKEADNSKLFIKAEDKLLYQIYLKDNISTLLDDPNIHLDTKASFINQIAAEAMNTLFESEINKEHITQIDTIIDNSVQLILQDNKAMYSMLKVTSYDYYTYTHCIDVAAYAIGFGVFLGLNEQELTVLGKAAMLHDIGKKEIDHRIITKNGTLTFEEFEIVKQHPQLSVKILKELGETDETLLQIIEQHHEKCDGSGYPYGLKEPQIHDLSKIVAICDIFNALTTRRTYKERMNSFFAFNIMFNEMKNKLSASYLKKFILFMGHKEEENSVELS